MHFFIYFGEHEINGDKLYESIFYRGRNRFKSTLTEIVNKKITVVFGYKDS